MTIKEIKKAVDEGKSVHWSNESYSVIKDKIGQYLIVRGSSCWGLTNKAGNELNGTEDQFYIQEGSGLFTDDMDISDAKLDVYLSGNGDYYIELKETQAGNYDIR